MVQIRVRTLILATTLSLTAAGFLCQSSPAESKLAPEASFLPTWKLLRNEGKQQFVAGYLFGWRDAGRVTDAVIEYAREHPNNAVSGLERIRGLYDMDGLTAESMVRELDAYFASSEGKDATISQAITAARRRLGR